MPDALQALVGWLLSWEALAVALAVAYLLLAVRQNILCWVAALISTAIFLFVFAAAGLYMESALQVFYMAMAVYGWTVWRRGGRGGGPLPVSVWPWTRHVPLLAAVAVLSLSSGWALSTWTQAQMPYLDSMTTWASLFATWMVARKLLENWYYWFVIDAVNIHLYINRSLYLSALLYAFYLVIIVYGFVAWRRDMRQRTDAVAAVA